MKLGKRHILVVEDDGAIRDMIAAYLGNAGFEVTAVGSGLDMQRVLEERPVDLMLLDLNLPDSDGLELARAVRARSRMGIIIVTERSDPDDRATGLELGADDYITKPFFPREMLARVRNLLDRSGGNDDMLGANVTLFDRWIFDQENRRIISADGVDPGLTPTEFDLLAFLVAHPQQLLSREAIQSALGDEHQEAGARAIDILVSRLRKKLGDSREDGQILETIRGHGYRFAASVTKPPGA